MVLGDQLEDLFERLFSSLSNFSNSVSNSTGVAEIGDAAKVMLGDISDIKLNLLPKIFSDTVFITENFTEEITEVIDIEADTETPVQVAGVRG